MEPESVYAVHYSCGLFDKHNGPSPVGHIVVYRPGADGKVITFDSRRDGERKALEDFGAFVASVQSVGGRFVHWKMRSERFGFDALAIRCEALGGRFQLPLMLDTFDIAEAVKGRDPEGYDSLDHPRLDSIARRNGLTLLDNLSPDEREDAFAAGEHGKLLANTHRRVRFIWNLYRRFEDGTLAIRESVPTDCDPADVAKVRRALAILGPKAQRKRIEKTIRDQDEAIGAETLTTVLDYLRSTGEYRVPARRKRARIS